MEVKINILQDEAGRINLRLIVLMSIALSGVVIAVLYFPPLPISANESTSGDIAFVDSAGNALFGAIEISGTGMPGEYNENVNFVSWDNVPNASIYFNVFDAKNLSVNLRIVGDSPQSKVMIENYGIDKPMGVNVSVPGVPVKYVEITATNVFFTEAEIYIRYSDKELGGQEEETLAVYFYDGMSPAWSELPISIDAANNTLSTTVNSLSVFAISARDASVPDKIEIHDARKIPVLSDIKTYDEARALKKAAKTTALSTGDIPDRGEFEVDALDTKNVAVKLKLNKVNRGEVILDDFGKRNPVSVPLQGRVVKYVEIGASGVSYSSADITIRYDESELNGGNKNDLTIYHWNGAAWEALPTAVDLTNKTLTATATSLSPFGVATDVTYYLENNVTSQSIGADGSTDYNTSNAVIGTIPYKNLLKNGAMGTQENISYPVNAGQTYEVFRFYLPFNYSVDTQISANAAYKITWVTSASTTDTVDVSLIVYNPSNGARTVVGSARNTTTGGGTATAYTNTINNPQYTVPAGSRLVVQINTTATADGTSGLYFNDAASSYINVAETAIGATPYITAWHNNKTSDQSTSIGINTSEAVMFSATANQTITSWNWYKDNTLQSSTFDNFTTSWDTPGSYRIDLNATNDNGTSNTVTWFVRVQTLSPVYIPPSPININSTTGNFWINNTWQAGPGNVTDSYNVSVNGIWYNGAADTFRNTTTAPHGRVNITVRAYNSSGTGSLSAGDVSQNIQVPNNSPVQATIGDKIINEGQLLTFTVSATDADNDVLTYGTNATQGTINTTTGDFSWIPNYGDAGTYIWYFNSGDGYGGIASENIAVTVNNIPLSITSFLPPSETTTIQGTAQSFNITLNRTANITWYMNDTQVQTNTDVTSASYTNSTAGVGTWNVTVTAEDGIDTVSKSWVWTIDAQPPAIYIPSNPTGLLNTEGSFWVNYTWQAGAGNITDSYNVSVDGIWYNGTADKFRNTTTTPHGWVNITVWAYNSSGAGSLSSGSVSQNSRVQNNLPVQAAIENKNVTAGSLLTFAVSALDLDNDTIEYGTNATKGTLNPTTGDYSWQTSSSDAGTYAWFFNSSDNYGGAASEIITITVDPQTYNLSGYVINKSSNLPLSGASVQTNTGLTTATNAAGFYNFTGLLNGTYIVNASLEGYIPASITATISGANIINANISLSLPGAPDITSWGNSKTNDLSTSISINRSESITFNATANQTITIWNWLKDNTNQNNNFENFTTMWATPGTYNVSVNATSSNGVSNTVTWNIDVAGNLIVQGSLIDTVERPLNASIRTTSPDDILINATSGNSFNQEVPENGFIQFDANGTKQVSVKFKMIGDSRDSSVILDDYGRNNPVASALPGKAIKYVNISAINVSFDIAKISIYYTNAELGSEDENSLVIYHWNNAAWEPLLTEIDEINNTLTAITTSLSPFAVSAIGGLQTLRVTTNRYTVFAPFYTPTQTGYNEDNSSFTFAAGALVIDANGYPLASTNINYYIYSGGGVLKKSGTVTTNGNGIAFFSYNTFREFTTGTDTDFGLWTIKAERADNISINGIARVNINPLGRGGCSKDVCHHNPDDVNADSRVPLTSSPRSPYSDNFGMNPTKSMAYAAHVYKAATHGTSSPSSCNNCHTGTDRDPVSTSINSPWGVHKNLSCTECHKNPNTWPITIPDCYSSGCHPRSNNNLTNTSTLATIDGVVNASIYSTTNGSTVIPYSVHNGSQYGNSRGVPCWICHGPMHNITKPDPLPANTNNITEYTQCLSCHNAYQRHNSSVNCTVCHSQDLHAIKVFAQNATYVKGKTNAVRGNCTSCHQNPSFMSTLLAQSRAGSYSGKIPQVQKPLNHSNDPGAGVKWNSTPGYWNPDNTITACRYCHGNTLHNNTALGRPSLFRGDNTVNSSISSSTSWCASCHWQGYVSGTRTYTDTVSTYNFPSEQLLVPPEITGNMTYGANQSKPGYYNHSTLSMDDASCKSCHGSLTGSTTITGFQHNVGVGALGGADCIACHDVGGSAGAGKLVNFSAMNDTSAIHKNLNSGVTTSLPEENRKCWACHSNGSEPDGHPSNYKTPYKCEDCHITGAGQNLNFTPQIILNVTQHYVNASNVTTAGVTSCYSCHNRTEMMVGSNLDPDGSGSIYSGSNGGSNSSSHYGKKRSDMVSWDSTTYCNYCHNTSTRNITFFVSDFNNTISNHTSRATTPLCTDCHNNGRLHDSTLTKPASDDAYCSTCHGMDGNASTNNKLQHKGLNCTECHANSSSVNSAGKDIHAIKYLTRNNTFTTSNSSAVDCVTCHQTSNVDSSLSGFNAFKIVNPLHHSENTSNGSVWGSYWTTAQTACIYCHNSTLHSATPLGRILQWSPDYMIYGSIGSNFSCSDCHYSGDSNYTQMSNAFAGLLIPPEITNGTNWKGTFANYSNHSSPYDDQSCSGCHGSLLGIGANMSEFSHKVKAGITETGSGTNNASCISCHDINGGSSNHWINNSDINKGVHANLNRNATNSTDVSAENKKCWGCHDANGSQPINDMGSRFKNPYKCYDCHNATGKPYANVSNAPDVSEHYRGGLEIKAASGASDNSSSCLVCHNLAEMKVNYTENDIYNSNYSLASHYGRNRTSDGWVRQGISTNCSYCHQNESTVFITAMVNISNRSITDHSNYTSNPACTQCHNTGWIHNSTLTRTALNLPNSTFCLSCHGNNGTGGTNYTQAVTGYKEKHDNTVDCTECHLNTSKDIHPVKYLQPDASYSTNNYNAVNCASCHQNTVDLNFSETPPKIPNPMHHSDNTSNGSIWGNYWGDNTGASTNTYVSQELITTGTASGIAGAQSAEGTFETMPEANTGGGGGSTSYYTTSSPTGHTNVVGAPDNVLSSQNNGRINGSGFASSGSGTITKVVLNYYYSITGYDASDVPTAGYTLNAADNTTKTETGNVAYNYPNPTYTVDITSARGTWIWSDVQSLSLWLNIAKTGAPGSTANVDAFEVNVTTTGGTASYRLEINQNVTGILTGDNYYLTIKGKTDGDSTESYNVQVYDSGSGWVTKSIINSGTNTWYNTSLTVPQISGGKVQIRYADANVSSDEIQNILSIDYAGVRSETVSAGISSCSYCHNDTRHRAIALGRPNEWKGNNIVNSSITNQSNWCASCHWQGYVSGSKTYTSAVSAFMSENLSVPPEITNGSYAPRDIPGYYNHSLAEYNDSTCKNCHGKSLSAGAYMSEFTHNVTAPSCTNCHYYYEYMENVNRTEKFVNQSMFEASTHGSLRCEDCHTKGHKNIGARKACEDCHALQQDPKNQTERHNITSDPWNYSIPGVSGSAVNLVDCTICHDAGLYSNATSTYNYTEEKDCDYCHKYPDSTYP